jgi:hypothetical protein
VDVDPEKDLYRALERENADAAFQQYVSLKRRLNSFIRCLESRDIAERVEVPDS